VHQPQPLPTNKQTNKQTKIATSLKSCGRGIDATKAVRMHTNIEIYFLTSDVNVILIFLTSKCKIISRGRELRRILQPLH